MVFFLLEASQTATTWPEAFQNVGIAVAIAFGVVGFIWALTKA